MLMMSAPRTMPRLVEALKDTDETVAQEILALLKHYGKPMTMRELVDAVDVQPNKARRVVNALKNDGNVAVSPSHNGYVVSLT